MRITKHSLIILITIALTINLTQSAFYCSAFCTYQPDGTNYIPQCNGITQTDCVKCDDRFFSLLVNKCIPHSYYNQTYLKTQLSPIPLSGTVGAYGWNSQLGNARINLIFGKVQFFKTSSGTGGDDKIYKTFSSLLPHYAVRIRFHVQRIYNADMKFTYFIDNYVKNYNYNSYPSNQSLGDIVTSDKISHWGPILSLAFQVQFISNNQWIRMQQVIIFVSYCSTYCLSCNSSTVCNKCQLLGNGTQTYLYKGICYIQCPQTTYQSNILNTCQPCDINCQNCQILPSNCTQCINNGKYQAFLYNFTCNYDCPNQYFQQFDNNTCICPINGYYINITTFMCQPCAPECNSCNGSLRTQCINCSSGNYLVYNTTWCSRTCPSDQYPNNLTLKCLMCSPLCGTCQNSATQCTSCFIFGSNRYLYENQCIYQCPQGYQKNNITRKCDHCRPYFYSYLGICVMQCPIYYISNNQTKSCLHLSVTNFTLDIIIQNISILQDSQSMIFKLFFVNGLSIGSQDWLKRQSYYFTDLTDGLELNISSSGIKIIDNQNIQLTFDVPTNTIDQYKKFIVEFSQKLTDPNGIYYKKSSLGYKISQNPQFLNQYFLKREKYFFNVILIPVFIILFVLILCRQRATYQLVLQKFRALQLIGLSIFVLYPIQSQAYYLLKGLNYFNFQFFPNVYHMFVPNLKDTMNNEYLRSYEFVYRDMDFIRMIGSILLFIAFWITVLIVLKFIVKSSQQLFGWTLRLGADLIQIKILHSCWSSLIFTIINASSNNIFIFMLFILSLIFFGFVLFRYYKIYQHNKQINYLCLWRIISTFVITIAIFKPIIVFIILVLISLIVGAIQYKYLRQQTKQTSKYKWGNAFLVRDIVISIIPFLSSMGICFLIFYKNQIDGQNMVITFSVIQYVFLLFIIFIIIFLYYFYQNRQKKVIAHIKKEDRWQQKQLYKTVQQGSTLGNVIQDQNQRSSYIKDEFDQDYQKQINRKRETSEQNSDQNQKNFQYHQSKQKEQQKAQKTRNNDSIDDQPIFDRLYRNDGMNKTQIVRKKQNPKIQPLIKIETQQKQNQEVQFQRIELRHKNQRKQRITSQSIFIQSNRVNKQQYKQ